MKRTALAVACVVACGKSGKPAEPTLTPAQAIGIIIDFRERVCACTTIACAHPIRDEFDAVKREVIAAGHTFGGDDKLRFDAELQRLQLCGDGTGLTFWIDQ